MNAVHLFQLFLKLLRLRLRVSQQTHLPLQTLHPRLEQAVVALQRLPDLIPLDPTLSGLATPLTVILCPSKSSQPLKCIRICSVIFEAQVFYSLNVVNDNLLFR